MEWQKNPPNDFRFKLHHAFSEIPITSLPDDVRNLIIQALNITTVTPSSNDLISRNYRGLLDLLNFNYVDVQQVLQSENPTSTLLTLWGKDSENSIGKLLECLGIMERYDILDDLSPVLANMNVTCISHLTSLEEETEESREMANQARAFGLNYINRFGWGAHYPLQETPLQIKPIRLIFIHHSNYFNTDAIYAMKRLQAHKIIHYNHDDLPYNFVASRDGRIFEGRGWDLSGSHTRNYNRISISIGLLGNYEEHLPTEDMLKSVQNLIEFGVTLGKIGINHGIYPHNDASETLSPGKNTTQVIKSWPRFRALGPLPPPSFFLGN